MNTRWGRWFFRAQHQASTAGAAMDLDAIAQANPDWVPTIFGIANWGAATPAINSILVEGTDYPIQPHRFDTAPTWAQAAYGRLRAIAQAAVWSPDEISTPVFAAPPDTTPLFVTVLTGLPPGWEKRRLDLFAQAVQQTQNAPGYLPMFIPATTYSTSACVFLDEIQRHLLEPADFGATWPSGLWTQNEIVNFINLRVSQFLVETGILVVRVLIPVAAGQDVVDLPTDLIDIRRVAYTQSGSTAELPREDSLQADSTLTTWDSTSGRPSAYVEPPNPSLQVRLVGVPAVAGTLDLIYVQAQTPVTADCSSIFPLPDEWCVYVKYGVLADMLSKEGEANDPDRASYCERRFTEGVELAKLLLGAADQKQAAK